MRGFKSCKLIKYFWIIKSIGYDGPSMFHVQELSLHPTEGIGGGQVFDITSLKSTVKPTSLLS
jgi:hypothetical protein